MPDYRGMYDKDYIGHWDLEGKPVTVTIREVKAGDLTQQGGRKSKRPLVFFEGAEKALVLNKTNGKIIAGLYGTKTEGWVGKKITMYPTITNFGSETVECIRVKPEVPGE
jgi:hypothetical protein